MAELNTNVRVDKHGNVHINKKNRIRRFGVADFILLFFLTLFGILILYPFYNAFLVSIVPNTVYLRYQGLMLWPPEVTMEAYTFTFKSSLIWYGYKNSILITFFGTIYNMILTVLCAYALTKPIPGGKFIRFAIVFTMYFSGGLIPSYLLIKDLKLMDTIASMILPTGINIMYMLIISNYFKSLPPALEESAKIDGADRSAHPLERHPAAVPAAAGNLHPLLRGGALERVVSGDAVRQIRAEVAASERAAHHHQ